MAIFIRIYFLLIFLNSALVAQTDQNYRLSEISFSGLHKTDELVVRRLLQSNYGDNISLDDLSVDAQFIVNFPGIDNVSYTVDTIGNELHVEYDVDEIRTLLPIVNFGGIEGNIWFQLGITDINWRGKGNQLSAYYQNSDSRHSGGISYRVPRVGTSKWGYGVDVSHWASREPLFFPNDVTVQYNYDFDNIGLTGIYQFDNRHRVEFGASYFVERYSKLELASGETQPGPDALTLPKALGRLLLVADHINYNSFLLSGYHLQSLYQNVYTFDDPVPFNSLILQGRYYKMLPRKINLATRLRFGIASNSDSPFAPFVVDSHINLRGVGNRIERGTAQLILNAEIRRTVTKSPLWATQLVLFTDVGSWRDPGGELSDIFDTNNFRHFIGGGFRIIYRKIFGAVLRVDYGIDIYNTQESGIILGFGQYF
jgi:outer membrane protein assembly factor BamA